MAAIFCLTKPVSPSTAGVRLVSRSDPARQILGARSVTAVSSAELRGVRRWRIDSRSWDGLMTVSSGADTDIQSSIEPWAKSDSAVFAESWMIRVSRITGSDLKSGGETSLGCVSAKTSSRGSVSITCRGPRTPWLFRCCCLFRRWSAYTGLSFQTSGLQQ